MLDMNNLNAPAELAAFLLAETESEQINLMNHLQDSYQIGLRYETESGYRYQPVEIAAYLGKCLHIKVLVQHSRQCLNVSNPLLQAVRGNHLSVVQMLLTYEEVEKKVDAQNNLALIWASHNGHLGIVKELLTYDRVKEKIDANSNFALLQAASEGHLNVVQELLAYDKVAREIDAQNNEVLILAASEGHLDVMRKLLTYQCVEKNINSQKNKALIYAASAGHLEVVQELLKYSKVKENIDAQDHGALRWAVRHGHKDVVFALLSYPVVFSYADKNDKKYGDFIYLFIEAKLEDLRRRKREFALQNFNNVFDVTEEEARLICLIIKHVVYKNKARLLDRVNEMLAIPSVYLLFQEPQIRFRIADEKNFQ